MSDLAARGATILGLGAYRPRRNVPNDELLSFIDSTDEWIRTRSGIISRGWAEEDETLLFMATQAAEGALASAGLEAASLGMLLVATCSNGQPIQPLSARLAAALGTELPALEINATCAGFCYGLGLARDLVQGGTAEYVLVVGAERLTDVVEPTDRTTAFIFADGAGAVVVGRSDSEDIGPVVWGTDGARGEVLKLVPDYTEYRDDPGLGRPSITMQGRRVFKWAAEHMPKVAEAACKAAGISLADIDVLVSHQANQRITDAIVKALDLRASVVVADDIVTTGNTSSASVPLALHRMFGDGRLRGGETALLLAFGGGLAYAGQVVTLPTLR
jgi:3-oxoacyl-(acyl-carrier-protein) synthase III